MPTRPVDLNNIKGRIAQLDLRSFCWNRLTQGKIAIIEESQEEKPARREVADEIDRVLAAHYGFTDEELDFIPSTKLRAGINYDIKYRMGKF